MKTIKSLTETPEKTVTPPELRSKIENMNKIEISKYEENENLKFVYFILIKNLGKNQNIKDSHMEA